MILRMKAFRALCSMEYFEINGIKAKTADFGCNSDHAPEEAEPYGCGNMQFERIDPTEEVLARYGITEDDYNIICTQLETVLSFGPCGWCV